jgi:hypothetical protein
MLSSMLMNVEGGINSLFLSVSETSKAKESLYQNLLNLVKNKVMTMKLIWNMERRNTMMKRMMN